MSQPAGKTVVTRRELIRMAIALGLFSLPALPACSASPRPGPATSPPPPPPPRLSGRPSLWSWFDLPEDPRSRELSGIAWDGAARTLWAVQDDTPRIVALHPDEALRSWRFGEGVEISVSGPLDLEGIVVVPEGFIICSEDGPRIVEIDRAGKLRSEVQVPARFGDARINKSLESLTMSPSARYLFTTSEAALERDGETATRAAGTRVRILRLERHKGEVSEHVYTTDPALRDGASHGVSDLAALSDDELLVLERGWTKGTGNTARIYRVRLEDDASCLGMATLPPDGPTLRKTLVADFAELASRGVPAAKQPQANPILDNYEGLAVGPRLPDGRSTLLVISDDNARSDQYARIVVLAFG